MQNNSRYIKNIKEIKSVPTKCLTVDSESHLFLAGEGLIPTHNSGKTILMGMEGIVQLLLSPRPTEENYIVAGDKDQANYVLQKMKDFIGRNPNFQDLFNIYKNEITIPSTGAKIEVLSSAADTKSGKSPDWFLVDEFWVQADRALWDNMWLGMAARPFGQAIILTNAGFDIKSICYEVREMCKSGDFKNFYWFEPTGTLLESLKMPWITEDWLDIERRSTPPKIFNRFRKNLWIVEGENPFMPEEGWDCFKPYLLESSSCNHGPHYVGLDFGLKKDAAAMVVLHREGKRLKIDLLRRWLGSSEVPVSIQEIENSLIRVLKDFNDVTFICDPWQLAGTLQRMKAIGVPVVEFYLTVQNITKLSKNLYYLLKNVELLIPNHDKLRDELKGMQVVEKSYGWRIDHSADTSSDITMALGMAALDAMEKGINEYTDRDLADLGFLNQSVIYKADVKREYSEVKDIEDTNLTNTKEGDSVKIHTFIKRRF